ncbi:uncharacterized protein LOC143228105 [Tachypleus tridentatus]|uniref:uncharacterized protein LOC143228105 n=1 Tax=Tachypleus tridentatus TaxID=6853 RepID=UPI003FD07C88
MEPRNSCNKQVSVSKLEINFMTPEDEPAVRKIMSSMFQERRRDYVLFHFRKFYKNFVLWVITLSIVSVTFILTLEIFVSISVGTIVGCAIGFGVSWLLLHRIYDKAYPWSDRLISEPYKWICENNHKLLLGKIDGDLVATTLIKRHPTGATEIGRMFVRKEFRCNGIGRLMMKKCIDILKEEGEEVAYLINDTYNIKAKKFYIRNGFKVCSLEVDVEAFLLFKLYSYRMKINL